ncbi:MAG TPA: two-component system response regulator CreB [Candidatus Sulfotelmatobacter sp.]|nr:two-component system response regulator CreB [Candidatus Sulfotelmatobacter sp.]
MGTQILVVEDEPAIADTINYALSTDGFQPIWAPTGEAALKALGAGEIALVILDVGLPDINGFELFKRMMEHASVPVIFLTARSSEIDRVVGLELGADDYISKPFSPRELTARVRTVLRRAAKANGPDSVASGPARPEKRIPFAVDDERKTITFLGKPLELSRYEYRILKLLIARPGRVFSRDQIMEHAWDEPEASLDRTVDAHVKMIRAKLKAIAPEVDAIRTHRGEGYSLKDAW